MFFLYVANSRCFAHGSIHNLDSVAFHNGRLGDQGGHRGLQAPQIRPTFKQQEDSRVQVEWPGRATVANDQMEGYRGWGHSQNSVGRAVSLRFVSFGIE